MKTVHSWKPLLGLLVVLLITACSDSADTGEWRTESVEFGSDIEPTQRLLVFGDIDPDTPTRRLQRIRPLADHVADQLGWDPAEVKVKIGASISEVADQMSAGDIHVFVDSGYPVLLASRESNAAVELESLVDGLRAYHSVFIAAADSEVSTLADLAGRSIAFQERYSTSGFLLPSAHLLELGYQLQFLSSATAVPAESHVGFFFTGDEENTLAMIRDGITSSGVLSSTDYESLPPDVKKEFRVLDVTRDVPRKLLTIAGTVDPELKKRILEILLAINDEDRKQMVSAGGWNWEFSPLDDGSRDGIEAMEHMIDATDKLLLD